MGTDFCFQLAREEYAGKNIPDSCKKMYDYNRRNN
jgi:hypothetical protein